MDYCSSCRRHLNGALVCPGCGDYAPDIAPATINGRAAPGHPAHRADDTLSDTLPGSMMVPTVPAATWEYAAPGDTWDEAPQAAASTPSTEVARIEASSGADAEGVEEIQGALPAPQGRAARRRQMARWKKNQRRAVVATAVALVGGGLTVMGMDRQSTDRTQAATAPDAEGLGAVEEQGSQSGRTPDTRPDDARRTTDTPKSQSPSTNDSYEQSTDQISKGTETSPRTPSSPPSDRQQAQRGSSSTGYSADGTTDTPSGGTTTPPATDDSTGSGSGTDTSTGGDTSTGSDSGSGGDTGTGTGTGSSDDTSGGSDSGSDATSPSGLCLLGGVLCVS